MSEDDRDKVNKGLPGAEVDHTPLEWDEQWSSAFAGKKWHGKHLSPESPVTGVSYWDAMAYANYVNAKLPEPSTLRTARHATHTAEFAEWTTAMRDADSVYAKAHILLPPAPEETPVLENDPAARRPGRAFRLVYPAIPKTKK